MNLDNQEKKLERKLENGNTLKAEIRFHKIKGNSFRHFSITGAELDSKGEFVSGGCIHEEIGEAFPNLVPYFKWHLCSEEAPLHYVSNTLYWVTENNLDEARNCAIWPEATVEELRSPNLKQILNDRLPDLMIEFRKAMESLGFTW